MQSIWKSAASVQSDIVLGIDFGTSNSCVAVWRPDKKRVKIIKNTLQPIGDAQLGEQVDGSLPINESRRISAIKRCLGGTHAVCNDEVIGPLVRFNKEDEKITIRCEDKSNKVKYIEPEELASHIISYLKDIAEKYLDRRPFKVSGETVPPNRKKTNLHKVVIGVPANYTDRQKDAIRSAAALSGFDEVHLMVESTAAAMSYGLLVAGSKNVLVVDIGGGTLDLTVLNINDGVHNVEAVAGHMNLGGCLMDVRLCELVEKKFSAVLLSDPKTSMTREILPDVFKNMRGELLRLCKICKEQLTDVTEASITLPVAYFPIVDIKTNKKGPHVYVSRSTESSDDIKVIVTRDELESAIKDITSLITASIKHTVEQWIAQKNKDNQSPPISVETCLDEIVLVGGASRVPAVRAAIRTACEQLHTTKFCASTAAGGDGPPHELCTALNPDEIVAEGLALRGAVLAGADTGLLKDVLMMDCMAMSIGLMSWGSSGDVRVGGKVTSDHSSDSGRVFEAILWKGDKIPAKRGKKFRLADPRQRFVSLDIYEEIDQLRLDASSSDDDVGGSGAVTEYKHHLISTVDVPVPQPSGNSSSSSNSVREIEVVFCMDERGFLSYETYECSTTSSSSTADTTASTAGSNSTSSAVSGDSLDESSQRTMFYLGLYLVLMVVLYLTVKILLVDVVENSTGSVAYPDSDVSIDDGVVSEL